MFWLSFYLTFYVDNVKTTLEMDSDPKTSEMWFQLLNVSVKWRYFFLYAEGYGWNVLPV